MKRQRSPNFAAIMIALAACIATFSARADDAAPAKSTGTISGKVVNKDGPVSGAAVRAVIPNKPAKKSDPSAPATQPSTDQQRAKIVATAITNADGTYTLTDVPAGRVRIIATLKGFGFGYAKGPVKVIAGQDTKVEDITLTPRQPKFATPKDAGLP